MAKANKQSPAQAGVTPVAVAVALAQQTLVLGPKQPKHRAGHNLTAWQAIAPLLPATAASLAALPAVQQCGGPKGNGALFLGYAIRRGWLAIQS